MSVQDPAPPASETLDRQVFERIFLACCRVPAVLFAIGLAILTVLRCGWNRYEALDVHLDFAKQFPVPIRSYKATSVVGTALAFLLGIRKKEAWWYLHIAGTLLLACVAGMLIARLMKDSKQRRAAAILLMLSPAPIVLLQLVGHYDLFTLFGGILLGLAPSWPYALLSGLLVGFSHGEQGVVMAAATAAVGTGLRIDFKTRIAAFVAACGAARLFVWCWFAAYDWSVRDRAALLDYHLARSVLGFLRASTAALYTWYGPLWIVILAALWAQRHDRRSLLALVAGLIVIPGLATVVTLDGTRVFICCALPGLCWLLRELLTQRTRWSQTLPVYALTGIIVIAAPFLPAYMAWRWGRLLTPWAHVVPDGRQ
jgi:hypothetical protein